MTREELLEVLDIIDEYWSNSIEEPENLTVEELEKILDAELMYYQNDELDMPYVSVNKFEAFLKGQFGIVTQKALEYLLEELKEISPAIRNYWYPAWNDKSSWWKVYHLKFENGHELLIAKGVYEGWAGRWLLYVPIISENWFEIPKEFIWIRWDKEGWHVTPFFSEDELKIKDCKEYTVVVD